MNKNRCAKCGQYMKNREYLVSEGEGYNYLLPYEKCEKCDPND